jgi:hypothetical protein
MKSVSVAQQEQRLWTVTPDIVSSNLTRHREEIL